MQSGPGESGRTLTLDAPRPLFPERPRRPDLDAPAEASCRDARRDLDGCAKVVSLWPEPAGPSVTP